MSNELPAQPRPFITHLQSAEVTSYSFTGFACILWAATQIKHHDPLKLIKRVWPTCFSHFFLLNINFSIKFVDEVVSGDTRNAVYKLWGCSADVEHPKLETDEADTIPD